ncbi:hypothetical protein V5799_008972 [Amblyomma americanum]|uniref:Calponin-homology (CH) domain-containing protein n=1 Tax=Amblyomma americanum TaxID=6943 RepID=A0AAQ4FDA9_AMBAM
MIVSSPRKKRKKHKPAGAVLCVRSVDNEEPIEKVSTNVPARTTMDDKTNQATTSSGRKSIGPSKKIRYSTSRIKVLEWMAAKANRQISEASDLSTGEIFCQVMHAIFPRSLSIRAVKKGKIGPHEVEANFNMIKRALLKVGSEIEINVEKLTKGSLEECLYLARYMMQLEKEGIKPEDATPSGSNAAGSSEKGGPPKSRTKRSTEETIEELRRECDAHVQKIKKIEKICDAAEKKHLNSPWLDQIRKVLQSPGDVSEPQ